MKKLLLFLTLALSLSISSKEIKLTKDNTTVLRSSFNASSVTKLKQDLLALDANLKSGYPIYLVLNTPGGSIQKGLELFEFVKGLKRPVHTITIFAASMGFQTVQSLGKRYILKYGVLMSHKARGGFSGEFGGGLSQLDSRYSMWLKRIDMLDKKTVSRSKGKQTLKSYRAAYDNELWLNGPEAVSKGYADAVVNIACDSTLVGKSITDSIDLGFVKIKVDYSACPMITSPVSMRAELLTNEGYMSVDQFLAKNGKFGKKCQQSSAPSRKYYFGNVLPKVKTQLCSYDQKITLESIRSMINKKEEFLNRDLRNHVKYSY